ncbi:MAG: response regulator [Candidatus Electrothrix sp. LOE1_4_5]|jgi:DNA-binding response OmpR family regulator|nr:response regulator [Candidatus Electrothrix gigas]MCI5179314.1 response regulator [Candidatus Electrothrix gigas]MCI5192867.1 response regulator [Candidatus Electrothrix gigas]MCI5195135.1 response regulator [Candidatus Electrothrix gigas]MCI5225620.1 response regulator [Candidatus Electrothrix gigas]
MEKKKVLLVDDEESILLLYSEEIEEEGFAVEVAHNGDQALGVFKTSPPDLVILDINMPGMNGIEVLRQMKDINADLPIILSSAYPEYKENLGAWASDEYIVKSANTDELKAAVHKYLD